MLEQVDFINPTFVHRWKGGCWLEGYMCRPRWLCVAQAAYLEWDVLGVTSKTEAWESW